MHGRRHRARSIPPASKRQVEQLLTGMDVGLHVDMLDMRRHGIARDGKLIADIGHRSAVHKQDEHLGLALGQAEFSRKLREPMLG